MEDMDALGGKRTSHQPDKQKKGVTMVTEFKKNTLLEERARTLLAEHFEAYEKERIRLDFKMNFGAKEAAELIGLSDSTIYKKLTKPDPQMDNIVMLRPMYPGYTKRIVLSAQRCAEFSVRRTLMDEGEDINDIEDVLTRR